MNCPRMNVNYDESEKLLKTTIQVRGLLPGLYLQGPIRFFTWGPLHVSYMAEKGKCNHQENAEASLKTYSVGGKYQSPTLKRSANWGRKSILILPSFAFLGHLEQGNLQPAVVNYSQKCIENPVGRVGSRILRG